MKNVKYFVGIVIGIGLTLAVMTLRSCKGEKSILDKARINMNDLLDRANESDLKELNENLNSNSLLDVAKILAKPGSDEPLDQDSAIKMINRYRRPADRQKLRYSNSVHMDWGMINQRIKTYSTADQKKISMWCHFAMHDETSAKEAYRLLVLRLTNTEYANYVGAECNGLSPDQCALHLFNKKLSIVSQLYFDETPIDDIANMRSSYTRFEFGQLCPPGCPDLKN